MTSRRLLAAGLGAALLAPLAAPAPSAAAPVETGAALVWLAAQQQADGGFETAGTPGFETPDVVAAVAAAAQGDGPWDTGAAREAVEALRRGDATPLAAVDALVDGVADPASDAAGAQAAKVVALVAARTGVSATDFDPAADSDEPVDLLARMDAHRTPEGGYDFGPLFNGSLYAALALDAVGSPVPAGLLDQVTAAQRSDGSWNYAGDQDAETAGDVDTTALALLALAAGGRDTSDPDVREAVTYLAGLQQPSGAWPFFGADDPNSTSMAAIALSALGVDVADPGWTTPYGVARRTPYVDPYAWLRTQQLGDGRVVSPNDDYGINTLATSQTVQAASVQWHLRRERVALVEALVAVLASSSASAEPVGYASLGGNPSTGSARWTAAHDVAMSQAGREQAAAELFQRAFGRRLDSSGRAYWSARLVGDSRAEVLAHLTGSPEFYQRSGATTEGFVRNAYRAVLGREPDTAGLAWWSERLDAGAPVESVAQDLVASREYRAKEVDAAYRQVLGRDADAGGRDFWTERLRTTRVEAILAGLGGSAEFYRRHS